MENNSEIPDRWEIPNVLAKKISETLNKKPISPENELADAPEEMAQDIALLESDPEDAKNYVRL
jgi:hypothetical protein